ncbi:MAG: glycosyltransferase family 4 protein [Oscillospiraceae bacterium]|nr:glycosyltransferase family 4 protein [Oscillospiraceae bacterium]
MKELSGTNKRKIVILTNNASGLISFREELLRKLAESDNVLVVLPPSEYTAVIERTGCHVYPVDLDRRGMNPIHDLKLYRAYRQILKREHPDAVITYTVKPNVYGGRACAALKIPYLCNITGLGTAIENGGLLSHLTLRLYRIGLKHAACVFFQNEDNLSFFRQRRVVSGKTRLIPGSGVNLEHHRFEEYPSEEDGYRFLFVGRVMRDKGVRELLEAFRTIHSSHLNVMLHMIGSFDEDYQALIKQAEADGFLRYHGIQKDVHRFYQSCHCVVLPSYHEGMANVLLEAASTGRPVIATRVPGCKETFDEDCTGYGCEAKNTNSLVDALEHFLSGSEDIHRKMGKKARDKMCREFNREIVIRTYLEELENAEYGSK